MKEKLIDEIKTAMRTVITADQMSILCNVLNRTLQNIVIAEKLPDSEARVKANSQLQTLFISAKRVEGCSEKTLKYYASTIEYMLRQIDKNIVDITTTDLRCYLASYQSNNQSSKVTIDNIRRIFSSFFAWLEDEDYILKSPVRRIHKVKTGSLIKEVLSDENLEILRDNCTHIRDLAIVDMLSSTGIRVGELVKINREDIDFHERECVVFGKGNKEREVYFNARTKIHLKAGQMTIRHSSYPSPSHIIDLKLAEWSCASANSVAKFRFTKFIRINSAGHLPQWPSTKECRSNRCRNYWDTSK